MPHERGFPVEKGDWIIAALLGGLLLIGATAFALFYKTAIADTCDMECKNQGYESGFCSRVATVPSLIDEIEFETNSERLDETGLPFPACKNFEMEIGAWRACFCRFKEPTKVIVNCELVGCEVIEDGLAEMTMEVNCSVSDERFFYGENSFFLDLRKSNNLCIKQGVRGCFSFKDLDLEFLEGGPQNFTEKLWSNDFENQKFELISGEDLVWLELQSPSQSKSLFSGTIEELGCSRKKIERFVVDVYGKSLFELRREYPLTTEGACELMNYPSERYGADFGFPKPICETLEETDGKWTAEVENPEADERGCVPSKIHLQPRPEERRLFDMFFEQDCPQ